MKIIRRRTHTEVAVYHREFSRDSDAGFSGFSFPCDEHGNLHPMSREEKVNFEKCLNGTYEVKDLGVVEHIQWVIEAAIGECACGREVYLSNSTNACDCGREYNSAGQELAPREEWGWETGEDWRDLGDI